MHSQRQRWRRIHARPASVCERVVARRICLARARSAPRLPWHARPRTGTRTGMTASGDSRGARSVHVAGTRAASLPRNQVAPTNDSQLRGHEPNQATQQINSNSAARLPSRILGIKRMSGESLSPSCACFLWVSSSSTCDGFGG
jgi:hypothetical protein